MYIYFFEKLNPHCCPNLFLVIIITITINQWLKLSLFLFERGLDHSLYKLEFLSPKNALSLACLNFNRATFGKKAKYVKSLQIEKTDRETNARPKVIRKTKFELKALVS